MSCPVHHCFALAPASALRPGSSACSRCRLSGHRGRRLKNMAALNDAASLENVLFIACSPTDATLVASGDTNEEHHGATAFLWRLGSEEAEFEMADTPFCLLDFSFDGTLLACASCQDMKIWNIATRTLEGTLRASKLIDDTVNCGNFTPDGTLICTGSCDSSLRIWDPKTAECKHVVKGRNFHTKSLNCLSISLDSLRVASGSADGSVSVVEVKSGKVIHSLTGFLHDHSVEYIAISPGYNRVAAGSVDGNLIIWNLGGSKLTCKHDEKVRALAWLGSSRYLASRCGDHKVRIWDSDNGGCVRTFSGRSNDYSFNELAVSADSNYLIFSSGCYILACDISMFK